MVDPRSKKCIICEASVARLYTIRILRRYNIALYRCKQCGFLQSEQPYWLDETYAESDAYPAADAGCVARNNNNTTFVEKFLSANPVMPNRYLDFGTGVQNLLVKRLRERGHNFYAMEPWYPGVEPAGTWGVQYGLICSFEVFEHLLDPVSIFKQFTQCTDTIIIGTHRAPHDPPPATWSYYNHRWGAHISIFTTKALDLMGHRFGFRCEFDDSNNYERAIFRRA